MLDSQPLFHSRKRRGFESHSCHSFFILSFFVLLFNYLSSTHISSTPSDPPYSPRTHTGATTVLAVPRHCERRSIRDSRVAESGQAGRDPSPCFPPPPYNEMMSRSGSLLLKKKKTLPQPPLPLVLCFFFSSISSLLVLTKETTLLSPLIAS